MQHSLRVLAAVAALAGLPLAAVAQEAPKYPSKTPTVIVTASAGASSDTLTRTVARKLGAIWGVEPIVENIGGAGGSLGLEKASRAPADGLTIVVAGDKVPLSAIFFGAELSYDPIKDFSVVTEAVANPQILVVRPELNVKTLDDYLKLAREKDGKLVVGTPGNGGAGHLAHEVLAQATGTKYTYVPYKGGAPATTDLLGGHVDAVMITLAAVTEHVRAGRLVGLGVTTAERSTALPNVPTIQEQGVKGYALASWQGFFVRSNTPRDLVEKISADFRTALTDPEVKSFLEGQGYVVVAGTPEEGDKLVRDDFAKYGEVVKSANIKVE
ncbi:Bug family tripartite tricarboxylate transporter substrate binding protein [Ancylobacter sp. G4_0304]|uniref:Bug family tripartite tricarboxylate transporter substrate binding protein n=1 Tax=Ancylobacter sp. G4_0304 TaxID=3114289 RepID=UPI0039C5B855